VTRCEINMASNTARADIDAMLTTAKRCSTCCHAMLTGNALRLLCMHPPRPALLISGRWPSVFYSDACGYWESRDIEVAPC